MVARENSDWSTKKSSNSSDMNNGTAEEGRLHPLWEEFVLPDKQTKFYYNSYARVATLDFPEASNECLGGILADGEQTLLLINKKSIEID